jgi:hypothetical protein
MPQNPNYESDSPTVSQVFSSVGVFSDESSDNEMTGAFFDTNPAFQGLYVVMPSGDAKYFDIKLTDLVSTSNGDMIGFQAGGASYLLRTFSTDDGSWASKYKIELPVEVLEQKTIFDSKTAFEKLFKITLPSDNVTSFGEDFSVYYGDDDKVSAIVYSCIAGSYERQGANWVQSNFSDGIYEGDYVAGVNPDNAQDVIDAFYAGGDSLDVNKIVSSLSENEDPSTIDNK